MTVRLSLGGDGKIIILVRNSAKDAQTCPVSGILVLCLKKKVRVCVCVCVCVRVAVECRRMHMNREGGGMREQRCIRIIYYYYYSTLGLEVLLCLSHVNSGCVLSVSKVKKSKELST